MQANHGTPIMRTALFWFAAVSMVNTVTLLCLMPNSASSVSFSSAILRTPTKTTREHTRLRGFALLRGKWLYLVCYA